jgi:hypothetical protein
VNLLNRIRDNFQKLPESITPSNEREEWYKNRKDQHNHFMNKEKLREIDDRNQKIFSKLT